MRRIHWIFGTILAVSLATSGVAQAAPKSARIHAAKQYRATQIAERDVVVKRIDVGAIRAKRASLGSVDQERQVLIPNPDAGRQFLIPIPESERQFVLPNPDAGRQFTLPNPDAGRQVLLPNPSSE